MPNSTTASSGGPWQLLIHDPSHDDPKWVLCTVASPGDVRPAAHSPELDEVTTRWVAARHGLAGVALEKLARATVWRVDESRPEGS